MFGLIMDLAGILNQFSLNTLTFDLQTFIRTFLYGLTCCIQASKKRSNKRQKQRSKTFFTVSC